MFLSDFVFAQGTAVIFKVALCLLSSHEAEIVECDGFESIVDYLKTTLPALSQTQMEQTIVKVPARRATFLREMAIRIDNCVWMTEMKGAMS